jgi:coenzyme F420-reducing hydrogenase alpha subunit
MSDKTILEHIAELVAEERRLRNNKATSEQHTARAQHIAQQLDQCWDLLRQRRARREFGEDPDAAKVRDIGTVEGYEG